MLTKKKKKNQDEHVKLERLYLLDGGAAPAGHIFPSSLLLLVPFFFFYDGCDFIELGQ